MKAGEPINPANIRQNVVPPADEPEYKIIRPLGTLNTRPAKSYDELRANITQRRGETEPKVDIRVWTIRADGHEAPHRGGLALSFDEARKLRDLLNAEELDDE